MANLFVGEKSSLVINLDHVTYIEVERNLYVSSNEYKIKFHFVKDARANPFYIYYDYTFSTEQEASDYITKTLNLK